MTVLFDIFFLFFCLKLEFLLLFRQIRKVHYYRHLVEFLPPLRQTRRLHHLRINLDFYLIPQFHPLHRQIPKILVFFGIINRSDDIYNHAVF